MAGPDLWALLAFAATVGAGWIFMIFRQLFEPESSTFTYLLGCPETRLALLIDPVLETVDRDLEILQSLDLTLSHSVETHVHADHVTSASQLRSLTGSRIACPAASQAAGADDFLSEVQPLHVGQLSLKPLYTPGHTDDHHSYLTNERGIAALFTGDALLIDGCGRTDFQNGDSATLYRSVHDRLFSLPEETLVYPAHDYQQRRVSTIGQERARNPRLGGSRSVEEFVEIMAALDLPRPRLFDVAVPANRRCGDFETSGTPPAEARPLSEIAGAA